MWSLITQLFVHLQATSVDVTCSANSKLLPMPSTVLIYEWTLSTLAEVK
jgi:hypothetical protein